MRLFVRAIPSTPVDRSVAYGCCFTDRISLRQFRRGSASTLTTHVGSRVGRVTRRIRFACATARTIASPHQQGTFTVELSLGGSPQPNVDYDYAGKQPIPAAGLAPARHTALWAAKGNQEGRREKNRSGTRSVDRAEHWHCRVSDSVPAFLPSSFTLSEGSRAQQILAPLRK